MDERIYYHGSDGHIKQLGDQELQHYKYIKKIGNRYFYTPEELKAYYNDEKSKANAEAIQRNQRRDAEHKIMSKHFADANKNGTNSIYGKKKAERINKRNAQIENIGYKTGKKITSVEKKMKPIVKTAKKAVTPKERVNEILKRNETKKSSEVNKNKIVVTKEVKKVNRVNLTAAQKQKMQSLDSIEKKKKKKKTAPKMNAPYGRWKDKNNRMYMYRDRPGTAASRW